MLLPVLFPRAVLDAPGHADGRALGKISADKLGGVAPCLTGEEVALGMLSLRSKAAGYCDAEITDGLTVLRLLDLGGGYEAACDDCLVEVEGIRKPLRA